MKTKMIMVCFALMSGAAFAQDSTMYMEKKMNHDMKNMDGEMPLFKDAKLGTSYTHYIHVKNALVASNSTEAKKGSVSKVGEQNFLKDLKYKINCNNNDVGMWVTHIRSKLYKIENLPYGVIHISISATL